MASPAGDAGGAASSANQVSPSRAAPAADSHKCSVCASCCSAGAILNPLPHMPEPEIATTVFAAVPAAVDVFAVDGPDRPPRALLANRCSSQGRDAARWRRMWHAACRPAIWPAPTSTRPRPPSRLPATNAADEADLRHMRALLAFAALTGLPQLPAGSAAGRATGGFGRVAAGAARAGRGTGAPAPGRGHRGPAGQGLQPRRNRPGQALPTRTWSGCMHRPSASARARCRCSMPRGRWSRPAWRPAIGLSRSVPPCWRRSADGGRPMFKAIIETSQGQRLLTLAFALVLMLYGAMVLQDTPVDVFPDLNNHHPADRGRRLAPSRSATTSICAPSRARCLAAR